MKKILVYGLEGTPFEEPLKKVATDKVVEYIEVQKTELRSELRELLRLPEVDVELNGAYVPAPDVWIHRRDMVEPLLLLYAFSNEDMEDFFNGMKAAGIPRIRLTAVATTHNLRWPFRALYQELQNEAAAMSKM